MKRFLSLMLVLFTMSVISQTTVLPGWDRTKWGMSLDEVLKVYAGTAVQAQSGDARKPGRAWITLQPLMIGGRGFKAALSLDKTKGLDLVTLSPMEQEKSTGAPPARSALFVMLDQDLTGKYGPPKDSNDGDSMATHYWVVDVTTIELTILAAKEGQPIQLFIKYKPLS